MGVIVASLKVLRGSVRLEGNRIVDPLICKRARNADHPASVLPMFASHCLPTCAVCLPHLRSPCSSITRTPFSLGAIALSSNKSSSRRSLTSCGSHLDSERNHGRLCASLRCAPLKG